MTDNPPPGPSRLICLKLTLDGQGSSNTYVFVILMNDQGI